MQAKVFRYADPTRSSSSPATAIVASSRGSPARVSSIWSDCRREPIEAPFLVSLQPDLRSRQVSKRSDGHHILRRYDPRVRLANLSCSSWLSGDLVKMSGYLYSPRRPGQVKSVRVVDTRRLQMSFVVWLSRLSPGIRVLSHAASIRCSALTFGLTQSRENHSITFLPKALQRPNIDRLPRLHYLHHSQGSQTGCQNHPRTQHRILQTPNREAG
jgi:hypothetical protein